MDGGESIASLRNQGIVGVAELLDVCAFTQTTQVDEGLGMLDSQTKLEGLRLDFETGAREGTNCVSRAMTDPEHDGVTGNFSRRRLDGDDPARSIRPANE
jgi:hypothetical protein